MDARRGADKTEAMAATGTHSRRTPAPRVGRPERGAAQESIGYAVLGGGPAGLTGAYVLALRDHPAVVFEADGTVGGIAKTVEFNGYRFDLGGHRFFTKLKQVERLWEELMGDDFLTRPRLSRIYYARQVLLLSAHGQGRRRAPRPPRVRAVRALLSLGAAQARPEGRDLRGLGDRTLRQAPLRRVLPLLHGEGLGHPGLRDPVARGRRSGSRTSRSGRRCLSILGLKRDDVTTLIEEFKYPRLGPGQMWERLQHRLEDERHPGRAEAPRASRSSTTDKTVDEHRRAPERRRDGAPGGRRAVDARRSSDLIRSLDPPPPHEVLDAADRLRYRDFCLVALMTDRGGAVPGQLDLPPRPGHAGRAGSRTSAPGARTWSCPARRASASSTSASRATTSGRCRARMPSSWPRTRWRGSA